MIAKNQKLHRHILSFYNSISPVKVKTIADIPTDVLENLLLFDEYELARPEIMRLLKAGKSQRTIAMNLGISRGIVQLFRKKYFNPMYGSKASQEKPVKV